MRKWVKPGAGLLALVCVYLALALAYGAATPDLEAPDAGGHWQYVAYLHEHWTLPAFTNETAAISHELVQQPPLYYTLTALLTAGQPVEASSNLERNSANPYYLKGLSQRATFTHWDASAEALAPLRVARGVTLVGGLLTVLFTWLLVWTLLPRQGWLALAVASVVALNPQFLFMSTAITNDLWAAALAVAAVWVAALAVATASAPLAVGGGRRALRAGHADEVQRPVHPAAGRPAGGVAKPSGWLARDLAGWRQGRDRLSSRQRPALLAQLAADGGVDPNGSHAATAAGAGAPGAPGRRGLVGEGELAAPLLYRRLRLWGAGAGVLLSGGRLAALARRDRPAGHGAALAVAL